MSKWRLYRHKRGLKTAISGEQKEVRFWVPADIKEIVDDKGERFMGEVYGPGWQFERVEVVPILSPGNAIHDTEDRPPKTSVPSGTISAEALLRDYELVGG